MLKLGGAVELLVTLKLVFVTETDVLVLREVS